MADQTHASMMITQPSPSLVCTVERMHHINIGNRGFAHLLIRDGTQYCHLPPHGCWIVEVRTCKCTLSIHA